MEREPAREEKRMEEAAPEPEPAAQPAREPAGRYVNLTIRRDGYVRRPYFI